MPSLELLRRNVAFPSLVRLVKYRILVEPPYELDYRGPTNVTASLIMPSPMTLESPVSSNSRSLIG